MTRTSWCGQERLPAPRGHGHSGQPTVLHTRSGNASARLPSRFVGARPRHPAGGGRAGGPVPVDDHRQTAADGTGQRATEEQSRPPLPGSPSVMVAVTSRDALAGLVALDGARRLDLDLLPTQEALALLRTLIG
jgi:hypothetical protein